jgi:hypothetical protein
MNPMTVAQTAVHRWEPTGVTGYPITHPIVGQTDFYQKFKGWLSLVRYDKFAHVFAVVGPWGIGKSRIGYEIVAEVNDTSKGWKVRGEDGALTEARLFDSDEEREKHLALYIRYSQVAHRHLNLDNWFAPAVYKALVPLARAEFDTSIQHQIAKQALDRLEANGFDPAKLAEAMELGQHDKDIYNDTTLATRLCNAAFGVLKQYGIQHVVVVLDELETAAERATGGMEAEEARAMDGKSITMLRKAVELLGREDIEMMSKAVKEEDARARFPWLRFVALCSPAIGDELKEVQSTDRRFEIVDLTRNAFSDVSAFVRTLEAEGQLLRSYPPGLVEAAYMMSGANFGWFNVIMAVVDQVLQRVPPNETRDAAWIFQRAIEIQERIGRYVLDRRSLDEIALPPAIRDAAAALLFGQQPVEIATAGANADALLQATNAHGEPVVIRYHRMTWRKPECMQILTRNRFQRLAGTAKYTAPGIPDAIDLERLLDDLGTLAVHEHAAQGENGEYRLLLPGTLPDFLQLLDLVHPHAAAEETGRTLWTELVGTATLPIEEATHIGPSVEMLRRLDIRLRKASVGTMLRDPNENDAFVAVQDRQRLNDDARARQVITGAFRLIDQNWSYDPEPAGLGDDVIAIRAPKSGLVDFKGLWLHPKGNAVLAWVGSDDALRALARAVATDHRAQGRYPVVAFTTDYDMPDRFAKQREFEKARESIVLIHLNSGEESALVSVGLPTKDWAGFRLRWDGFTTRFSERLNRIRAQINKGVREWRHEVSRRGNIAWPIRPNGTLKEDVLRDILVKAWRIVMLEQGGKTLGEVGTTKELNYAGVVQELDRLGLSPAATPRGYGPEDMAQLWTGQGPDARPAVPPFLLRSIVLKLLDPSSSPITQDSAKADWFWGYTWDNNRTTDIFREWMAIATDLGWVKPEETGKGKLQYVRVPREELRGELSAATKWLSDEYPKIVQRLSELLGPGAIDQWFKPGTGAKYLSARKRLDEAARVLDELDALEANPPSGIDDDSAQKWFVEATKLRLRARALVRRVFDRKAYEDLPRDLDGRTLQLMDDERPLWERIRQAEYFAEAVQSLAKRIRKRVPVLGDEMRADVTGIAAFPIQLFTRPLGKINDIVDAGLAGEDPTSSTQRAQHAKPDTLAFYLKDLRVADAMKALRDLAQEVGVVEGAVADQPFAEIKGDILVGFRDLKERYGRARTSLEDLTARVERLAQELADAPSDFSLPAGVSLDDVRTRPALIAGELEQSLGDDVEDLLDRHNASMNLGRFGPLMREASATLLDAPERSIKGLEGKVRTLENAVAAYRQELLKDPTLHRNRAGLNALRRAKATPEVRLPELGDLEKRSLEEGRIYIDGLATRWARDAEKQLDGTGVTFVEWLEVIERVARKEEPKLPPEKTDGLVNAGFLRRVYAIPGAT